MSILALKGLIPSTDVTRRRLPVLVECRDFVVVTDAAENALCRFRMWQAFLSDGYHLRVETVSAV
jgi:hypothetical protein